MYLTFHRLHWKTRYYKFKNKILQRKKCDLIKFLNHFNNSSYINTFGTGMNNNVYRIMPRYFGGLSYSN